MQNIGIKRKNIERISTEFPNTQIFINDAISPYLKIGKEKR